MYVFRECFIIKLLIVILMNMPAIHAHQGKILARAQYTLHITLCMFINSIVVSAATAAFLINEIMK